MIKTQREITNNLTSDQCVRHIVLFQFKDSATTSEVTAITAAFAKLPEQIDTIIGYEAGLNNSPERLDGGYTHAFVVTFKTAADRDAYLPHPAHQAFVQQLDGLIEKVLVFDFASHLDRGTRNTPPPTS